LAALWNALWATQVAGTVTNVAFLSALAAHPGFAAGDVDTGLIDRDLESLVTIPETPRAAIAVAALEVLGLLDPADNSDPWSSLTGFRIWGKGRNAVHLDWGDGSQLVVVEVQASGRFTVAVPESTFDIEARHTEDGIRITLTDKTWTIWLHRDGPAITVFADGNAHVITVPDILAADAEADSNSDAVVAPMTGAVRGVSTSAEATVSKGDTLILMEAMKMEHTLTAPRDGVVASVNAAVGDQVEEGSVLVALEPEDG
ncbi:MAG: biotin/lipoyl-containing protein, partial [Pseudomonadota bacterium]